MPAKATIRICALAAVLRSSVAAPEQEAVVSASRFGPVVPLNRRTFGGNVLEGTHVDHWVVLFCVDWFEPCQEAFAPYMSLAEEHSKRLNQGSLLRDVVRFGMVDCAVDKVLCNEQSVQQYPTVHHYQGGKRVATWVGGRATDAEKLAKFLNKHLGSAAVAAKPQEALASEGSEAGGLAVRLVPGERAVDFALVALVLALNAWAVFNNPQLWQKPAAGAVQGPSASKDPGMPQHKADEASVHREGVARFLPEGWSSTPSMEL
mmetsp:Transcript_20148/g.56740  ORF Transcript_20148/g.56740 Transcript_20148/m.56740 type:complete len:262 (+) Transcript_20148:112-897(+)